ncbi:hypothetical protein MLD38_006735 [Melastoma candidum]|uniref:Uncharacterized protein n=1 Tax=Melastoma candidum TaxID=119954 RepID=A0ACB9RQ59_9MYRT|nr:hypothetical protein MLD38_006735 [Melastoma candidum]
MFIGRLRRAVNKTKFILGFDIRSESEGSNPSSRGRLQRAMSYHSQEDDVDQRAELFIANFYRLQLERQVSLDLRYCRGNSFESRSPRWLERLEAEDFSSNYQIAHEQKSQNNIPWMH